MIIDLIWVLATIVIPWSLGSGIARWCCISRFEPSVSLTWGLGFVVGMYLIVVVGYALLILRAGLSVRWTLSVFLIASIILWCYLLRFKDSLALTTEQATENQKWPFFIVIVFSLSVLVPIVVDVWFRPLFPWDAWYSYGMRAKLIFELGKFPQPVTWTDWVTSSNPEDYRISLKHPMTISVIQAWMAGGLGRWSESLINIPWPCALVAVGSIGHGMVRATNGSALLAALAFGALISIPGYGVHTVLAGYLDIWLGLCLMAFAGCGYLWLKFGGWRLLFLVASTALAALATKQSAIAFLIAICFGLLLAAASKYWRIAIGAIAVSVIVPLAAYLEWSPNPALYITLGEFGRLGFADGTLFLPFMRDRAISGPHSIWGPLIASFLFSRNLMLLGYGILAAIGIAIAKFHRSRAAAMLCGYSFALVAMLHFILRYTSAGEVWATGTLDLRIWIPATATAALMALLVLTESVKQAAKWRD